MKILIGTALLLSLFGCALTPQGSVTQEQRTFSFIEKTNLSADKSYDLSLAYLAKNLGNSNQAVQVRDKKGHHLISQLTSPCKLRDSSIFVSTFGVDYVIDIKTKDNKIKINVEAKSFETIATPYVAATDTPIHESALPKVKICAEEIKNKLLASFGKKANDNW